MKKTILMLALGILTLWVAGAAMADTTTTAPTDPFTVKLGAAWATGHGSSTAFALGGDYAFAKTGETATPSMASVYIDSFNKDSQSLLGFGLAIRGYGTSSGQYSPYLGLGLGDYLFTNGNSNNSLGGKIFGGIELTSHFLGELSYTQKFSDNSEGVFGAELGYRF